MSFLAHYNASRGSTSGPGMPFERDLLKHVNFGYAKAVHRVQSVLHCKEYLSSLVRNLEYGEDHFQQLAIAMEPCFAYADTSGILGFMIESAKRTENPDSNSNVSNATARIWQATQKAAVSTIEACAGILLSMGGQDSVIEERLLENGDLQVKLAVALAMSERKCFSSAYKILYACAEGLKTEEPRGLLEYRLLMTELVKCCNILNLASAGEYWALQALARIRSFEAASQNDLCAVEIVLADSLMAQGHYCKAETVLNTILSYESLPTHLVIITGLRLNKTRRRLGFVNSKSSWYNNPIWKDSNFLKDSGTDLKIEVLEELSSTLASTQQTEFQVPREMKTIINNLAACISRDSDLEHLWLYGYIRQQAEELLGSQSKPHDRAVFLQQQQSNLGAGPNTANLIADDRVLVNVATYGYSQQSESRRTIEIEMTIEMLRREGISSETNIQTTH